jgi:hypothetical protein
MAACFYYFAIDLGHVITKQIQKLGSVIGTDLIADEIDVQDEWAIADECAMQRAMQAMKQEKKHCSGCSHNITMKSRCWYVISKWSMCFQVDCPLAFSYIQSTYVRF